MRMSQWKKTDTEYNTINTDPRNTFKLSTNKFADWTAEEFASRLLGTKIDTTTMLAETEAETDAFAEVMGCTCPKYGCRISYC